MNINGFVFCALFIAGFCWFNAPVAVAQEKPNPDLQKQDSESKEKLFWVFLTAGKSLEGIDRKEVEAMQSEHLSNFRRLAEEGKLLTAGPVSDPENVLRGVVVLKSDEAKSLTGMFATDPFVQQGYMKVETCPMQFELGKIHTRVAPKGMEELTLAILETAADTGAEVDSKLLKQTTSFLKSQYEAKHLDLSIRLFKQPAGYAQILVFPKQKQPDEIEKILTEIPAVKDGIWKPRTMPIFMGKGSIDREEN